MLKSKQDKDRNKGFDSRHPQQQHLVLSLHNSLLLIFTESSNLIKYSLVCYFNCTVLSSISYVPHHFDSVH